MIGDPKIFYDTYLSKYHSTKATYLKTILGDIPKYELEFFKKNLAQNERDEFRRTIKSDLRQTYFHSIESFFEIFFALNPKGKKHFDDEYILFNLTNSKWQENYRKIKEIAEIETSLDFLHEEILFQDRKMTIGNYIFYMSIVKNEKHPKLHDLIVESIEAIKYGIRIIAKEFINREEYNAYKHGLRIIPAVSKLMFADAETMEVKIEWDLTDSMSFYNPTKKSDEIQIITKLFDVERDYQMTFFCSNLIHHMIHYRKLFFDGAKAKKSKDEQIAISFFGKEPIEKCNKVNVAVQDLIHTIRKN